MTDERIAELLASLELSPPAYGDSYQSLIADLFKAITILADRVDRLQIHLGL